MAVARVGTADVGTDERSDGRRLLAAVRGLVRRFSVSERADVSCCGVTVAQAATLETLRVEGPMRLNDLGRRLGISPSTLTRNLARLEDGGLVAREGDADDARAYRVALTASGRRAALRLERQEEAFAAEILARLPEGDGLRVLDALSHLLAAVREATEDCCPDAFTHLMDGFPARRERRFPMPDHGVAEAGTKERPCDGCECE